MCPIFEYECEHCSDVVEVISSQPATLVCQRCGKPMRRKVSAMARTAEGWR